MPEAFGVVNLLGNLDCLHELKIYHNLQIMFDFINTCFSTDDAFANDGVDRNGPT